MESNTNESQKQGTNISNQEPVGFWNIMKAAYSDKPYLFWGINLFCIIIFFFVLDKNTGGGYGVRLFVVTFCIVVGGFFGAILSVSRNGSRVSWFRYGSGTLLVILTLMLWAGNGKIDSNGNYHSPHNGSNPSKSSSISLRNCPHCNGAGKRTNKLTGRYGSCSSCQGGGIVTGEQYKRLSK